MTGPIKSTTEEQYQSLISSYNESKPVNQQQVLLQEELRAEQHKLNSFQTAIDYYTEQLATLQPDSRLYSTMQRALEGTQINYERTQVAITGFQREIQTLINNPNTDIDISLLIQSINSSITDAQLEQYPLELRPYIKFSDAIGNADGIPEPAELARLMALLDPENVREPADQQWSDSARLFLESLNLSQEHLQQALQTPTGSRDLMTLLSNDTINALNVEFAEQRYSTREFLTQWIRATSEPTRNEDSDDFEYETSIETVQTQYHQISLIPQEHTGVFLDRNFDGYLTANEIQREISSIDDSIAAYGELKAQINNEALQTAQEEGADIDRNAFVQQTEVVDNTIAYLQELKAEAQAMIDNASNPEIPIPYMEPAFYQLPDKDQEIVLKSLAELGAPIDRIIEDGIISRDEIISLITNLEEDRTSLNILGWQVHEWSRHWTTLDGVLFFSKGLKDRIRDSEALQQYLGLTADDIENL